MAKDQIQWGANDTPAEAIKWGEADKPAAQRELPASVTPSTAGAGRGRINPKPRPEPEPVQDTPLSTSMGDPLSTGMDAIVNPTIKRESVLQDVVLPEPQFDPRKAERLSRRSASEVAPAQSPSLSDSRPARRNMADQGGRLADAPMPVRAVAKAAAGGAESVWGGVRAVADVVGAHKVARVASGGAAAAREFEQGMGTTKPIAGFGPKSPLPYLADMGEGAAASLGSSAALAGMFGARAVIPLMSVMSAGQKYDEARNAGLDPVLALANAVPTGVFEAVGEKFQGLDKAAGAIGVLMNKGAGAAAKKTAADVLVRSGIREIPGEVITYLGQTGVDLLPGIGIRQDLTMGQFLDGLRDTVVQAGMMGATQIGGGAAARSTATGEPLSAQQLAKDRGFLVTERIKKLKDGGDTKAAAVLQKGLDREEAASSSVTELAAMATAAPGKTFHASPGFQQQYRDFRVNGLKPAEAGAKAAMLNGFSELASQAGLSEKARAAALHAAKDKPIEEIPGFLERLTGSLAKRGMGTQLPAGTVEGALGAEADSAMNAVLDSVYADAPTATMNDIEALENAQTGTSDAAIAGSDAPEADFDAGNDRLVTPVDDGAHAAAASPLNDRPEPTKAQILAGNAALGHVKVGPLRASIETPSGAFREDKENDPPKWRTEMKGVHYGYVKRTEAADSTEAKRQGVDIFIQEGTPEDYDGPAFVVDQVDKGGEFDEHKAIVGPATAEDASALYLAQYDQGWTGLGAITEFPSVGAFNKWVKDGKKTDPASPELAARARPAAPVPAPAADPAAVPVQPSGDDAPVGDGAATAEPDGALSDTRTGRDGTLLSEGGKPFKTREAADKQRKLQPHLRVMKADGGFVLAEKTPAQLAAQEKAAKRLRNVNTSPAGAPIHAHGFLAGEGGLRREEMADTGFDKNVRVGNRTLFAAQGKGLTIEQATQKMIEAGYLPEGSLHTAAFDLIRKSVSQPQYTPEGWERLAQAESATRFEDHLAAQQDVEDPLGPIADYSAEQLEASGYAAADDATKAEVQALLALADDHGIDTDRIREDASRLTADQPEQAYYDAAKSALTTALDEGRGDRVAPAGEQGGAGDGGNRLEEASAREEPIDARPPRQDADKVVAEEPSQTPADAGVSASGPTWDLRASGTLAIKGNQTDILAKLKAGGITKTMVMQGGIMVGKTQAAKAQAIMEGKPAEAKAAKPLTVGMSPSDTVQITVKNGVIMMGKDEAINFDTGEPIIIAAGATDTEIKKALKDGGALSKRQKFFGGQADMGNPTSEPAALTAPTKEEVLAQQQRAADGENAEAQRKKDEQAKATADAEVGEFTLTGSNRAADVAAAAGQTDIFGGKIDDIGEKIGGARKDTAQSTGTRAPGAAADEDTDPAWRRRFTAVENVADENDKHWILLDSKTGKPIRGDSWKPRRFANEQAAQDAVPLIAVAQKHRVREDGDTFSIWRNVTDRKTVKVVQQDFPTREDAMRYMAEHAAEIVETRTRFGEDVLVKPEKVVRQGPERRTGPVTPEQFISTFGFRGVEFGNWNNQAERQEVMNHAYDGLLDMAELLNIPPKAISLNGDIGLGFGSRGHGLTSARAHYERSYGVMNLTKMQGAGALAHEWFHALDHYLGRQDGKASSKKVANERGDTVFDVKSRERDFASHGFLMNGSQVREALRTAFRDLMQSMFTKGEQYVEDTAKAEKFVGVTRDALKKELDDVRSHLAKQLDVSYYKRNNKPATPEQLAEWDLLADRLVAGEDLATAYRPIEGGKKPGARAAMTGRWTNDTLEAMSAIYKAVRGRAGMNAERSGALDRVRGDMTRYSERMKMLADAAAETTKTKKVPTSYAMDAKRIDQGATTDYWTTEHEMGARAFSAYVEDQLAAQNRSSDFLSYGSDNKFYRLFNIRPFPEGKERQAINAGFDRFFSTMKSEETDKGVKLYRRAGFDPKDPPMTTDQVKAAVDDITGKWKNGPKINVVLSARQLPAGAPENARGLYTPGNVWIVASRNRTRAQVAETLAHEAIAHWGLRDMLGRERWGKLMDNVQVAIASGNKPMREIQALVRKHYIDENGAFNLSKDHEADEIVAHAVERALDENGEFRPGFGFLKSVWAQVAEFLRDLGIDIAFTNAELQGMLVLSQRNLQAGERSAGRAPMAVAAAAMDETPMAARGQESLFRPDAWSAPEPTRTDKLIYELQDGRVDLKRIQEAIKKTDTIEEKFDARQAESLYPGRVARRTELFIEQEVKPLMLAMAQEKATLDEVADYLIARHAEERNTQVAKVNPDLPDGGAGRNSKGDLMTNDAAAAYLEAIPDARLNVLQALAKRVDAITKGTRKMLVLEGLEKADAVAAWEGAYANYVPLFKEESEHPHPQGMGFTVKGPASKRATGSTKQVTNVLAHVLMQREAAITRAEKNRVGLALYGLALTHPNPGFWTTIKPSMPNEQIGQELQRMGVDPTVAEAGMQGIPTIRTVDPLTQKVVDRPNPIYKNLPGAITLKVNGEDRVLLLNEKDPRALRMAEALKNLDGLTKLDLAGSIVGKTTRWMAAINTQYNPAFGFVNLVRDTLGGSINLGSTALRGQTLKVLGNVPAAMQGIARELSGGGENSEWSKLWKQFQDDGGRTGYRELFATADDRAKAVEKELANAAKAGKLTPGKVAHGILDVLDVFNTTLENSVRLSAYKAGLDKGLSRAAAAKLGRELTVDFNRKGRMGRELGPLYAFFNASVQGAGRTIEALKGPTGAKIIAGGLALGALQALLLAAMGYEDDEIPEFVKTRALIIPLPTRDGEKRFISIPYPLGLHVIPNTGRVITELSMNGGKEIGKRAFNAIGEIAGAFNPLGGGNIFTPDGALKTLAPTVVDPVIEIQANRNFAGSPIEKASPRGETDGRPGYARAKERSMRSLTGQAYIGISKAVNTVTGGTAYEAGVISWTPERFRYIAQTAGGGVLRELEKTIDASYKAMHGEKVRMSGIPLAGRFYGEVDDDQVQQTRYYDQGRKLDIIQSSLKAAETAGDGEAMTRMIEQHPEAILIQAHDRVQRELAKLNKLAVSTIGDADASKAIDEARIETMKSLNAVVKEMEQAEGKTTLGQQLRGVVKKKLDLAAGPAPR